ncbi:glucanase B [Truncatella angustata]|uniref:Glucanase B n=1 Tax=Truncatella angustata TaxID=152316 RepID=A0A9P8UUF8_9PEZI|nr:glucanase B [Truncatella angustata]KAH6658215.1 glucanase B [Truncatella angustata]
MTRSTCQFALKNSTNSSNAYAYITGLDLNQNNVPLLIQSDGQTVYHPTSPSQPLQALSADCAISLGAPGSTRTVTIPRIAGGRIWFVLDGQLTFLVNPGPAIVEPSVTNPSDPNYNLFWGFCEFTFNDYQLFVNISYVDFVSLPIALDLKNDSGAVQSVKGLVPGGLDTVCNKLVTQDNNDHAGWSKLIVKAQNGANLRALSPNGGIVMNNSLFKGYYQSYVDSVWQKYSSEALTVNTQAQWGNVTGKVISGKLTFDGVGTFAQPSAADIFSCSTGPFGGYQGNQAEMGAIGARLAAAFNRSTLLVNSQQPEGEQVGNYYQNAVTNHYSRICHETNADLRGYAFPYDDVGSSSGGDQSGSVFDGAPALLTVTLGGTGTSSRRSSSRKAHQLHRPLRPHRRRRGGGRVWVD